MIYEVGQLSAVLEVEIGPFKVLGGGSNILLTGDLSEHILINRIYGKEIVMEDEDFVTVSVGGGENWHSFVRWCIDHNYGGIENLSLIPGTVGAAPIQNIGAYGVEQNTVFVSLEAMDLSTGIIHTFTKEACGFGYRDSIFKKKYRNRFFITKVSYRLTKKHNIVLSYGDVAKQLAERGVKDPTIRDVSDVIIKIRNDKLPDPKKIGNSGSFFKNPVIPKDFYDRLQADYPGIPGYVVAEDEIKVPAGWLIDQCGWKGKRIGNTGTYKNQALVLVNHGDATGKEVYELAQNIMTSVLDKFKILLITEVNIW